MHSTCSAILAGGYDEVMGNRWFFVRAVATTVAVCVVTVVVSSALLNFIRRGMANSQVGRIDRGIRAITPDVQRRDKEVEDLTRP